MNIIKISAEEVLERAVEMHNIELQLNEVILSSIKELRDADTHWSREISKNMQTKLSFIGEELTSFVSAIGVGEKIAQNSVNSFMTLDKSLSEKNGIDDIERSVRANIKSASQMLWDGYASRFWNYVQKEYNMTSDKFDLLSVLDAAGYFENAPIIGEITGYKSLIDAVINYYQFHACLTKCKESGDIHDMLELIKAGNTAAYGTIDALAGFALDPLMGLIVHYGCSFNANISTQGINGLENGYSLPRIALNSSVIPILDLYDEVTLSNIIPSMGVDRKEGRDYIINYIGGAIDTATDFYVDTLKKVADFGLDCVSNPISMLGSIFS